MHEPAQGMPASETSRQKDRLVVFTRFPQPGETKTRLIPDLGAQGAADLQRLMTIRMLRVARAYAAACDAQVEVRFAGGSEDLMRKAFGDGLDYTPQGEGDLGERMARAAGEAVGQRRRVVIVGADCPGIYTATLSEAFAALDETDVVFGPASDGGYYLVGVAGKGDGLRELFSGIAWGGERVLAESLRISKRMGLSVSLLGELRDVDTAADLGAWQRVDKLIEAQGITVIIPTLNEGEFIRKTLLVPIAAGAEVIVADAGSSDATREIAEDMGARVILVDGPRASQANAAAEAATGEHLLFLHADSLLAETFAGEVRRVLAKGGVAAGAFSFSPEGGFFGMRFIRVLVDIRCKWLGMPYGDQGLFMRAETFSRSGGFPLIPIMDDFEFVRILRRLGSVEISPLPVVTSARRWKRLGVLRTTLRNQAIIAAYMAGVAPERLARWYNQEGA